MSKQGIEQAENIRDSLMCLKCDYSLRGLPGDIVTCPECGESINIAAVMMKQWTGPWFKAPLYNVLAVPLAWAFLILSIAVVGMIANEFQSNALPILLAILIVGAGVWVALLFDTTKKYGNSEGAFLALLVHLIFIGYILGSIGVIGSLIGVIVSISDDRGASNILTSVIILVVCISTFVISRLGEKFVAGRCIRQHVRRIGQV